MFDIGDNLHERVFITDDSWLDVLAPPTDIIQDIDFEELFSLKPLEKGKGMMYGKITEFPRHYQSFDHVYNFNGASKEFAPMPDILAPLKQWINNVGYGDFQETLVNWYNNGHDYIGAHADDEKDIKPQSPIVSVSLGATRKFRIRDKVNKDIMLDVDLPNGGIIVMCGAFQKELKHEIVKVNGAKGLSVGPRINITFRQFK
jgi:alkylated DNA repair dioxygenase AlkB